MIIPQLKYSFFQNEFTVYENYIELNRIKYFENPLSFYAENSSLFPRVASLARKYSGFERFRVIMIVFRYLAVAGSTIQCERAFSTSTRLFSNTTRNRLTSETAGKMLLVAATSKHDELALSCQKVSRKNSCFQFPAAVSVYESRFCCYRISIQVVE